MHCWCHFCWNPSSVVRLRFINRASLEDFSVRFGFRVFGCWGYPLIEPDLQGNYSLGIAGSWYMDRGIVWIESSKTKKQIWLWIDLVIKGWSLRSWRTSCKTSPASWTTEALEHTDDRMLMRIIYCVGEYSEKRISHQWSGYSANRVIHGRFDGLSAGRTKWWSLMVVDHWSLTHWLTPILLTITEYLWLA